VSELEGEGGEDGPKIAPVVEISGTEEARPEFPVRKADLRKRLGDGRLSGPCEAVEPKHALVLLIVQPAFELEEDVSPGPLHASLPDPTEVSGVSDVTHAVEKGEVRPLLFSGYCVWTSGGVVRLTMSRQVLS